jgi:hypothetical protein
MLLEGHPHALGKILPPSESGLGFCVLLRIKPLAGIFGLLRTSVKLHAIPAQKRVALVRTYIAPHQISCAGDHTATKEPIQSSPDVKQDKVSIS